MVHCTPIQSLPGILRGTTCKILQSPQREAGDVPFATLAAMAGVPMWLGSTVEVWSVGIGLGLKTQQQQVTARQPEDKIHFKLRSL